jgi:hypothetical protein
VENPAKMIAERTTGSPKKGCRSFIAFSLGLRNAKQTIPLRQEQTALLPIVGRSVFWTFVDSRQRRDSKAPMFTITMSGVFVLWEQ